MIRIFEILLLIHFLTILISCSSNVHGTIEPHGLKCEYSNNPVDVESLNPKLSWMFKSEERNQKQKAYQILVASTEEKLFAEDGNVWNSGIIKTDQSVHIKYGGKVLFSENKYYWKVRVWDKNSKVSEWSKPAYWEMGLLNQNEWKANWITYKYKGAPLFRKEFQTSKKISKARVYICGLGYYELYMNGNKIGDNVLDPGQTDYETRVFYVVHDITENLVQDSNVLGVELGNGFYHQTAISGGFGWEDAIYGEPRLAAQMYIWFEDGSDTLIVTGEDRKATGGPMIFNNIYVGDFYDARLELPGWNNAGFDDSKWVNAKLIEGPGGIMVSQKLPPIKRMETLQPKTMTNPKPSVYVYDIGQNFAGWAKLKIKAERGTEIRLRFSEEIYENGMIDIRSCGGYATNVEQTDKYICKGGGRTEIWEPKFTYHSFRYVEMTGYLEKPSLDNLEGISVYSSFSEAGDFSCSDILINKISEAAVWTAKSSLNGRISGGPARDKCGWLNDVTVEMLIYNFDIPLLLQKFEMDIETSRNHQKPAVSVKTLPGDGSKEYDLTGIPWDVSPGRRADGHRPDWGSTFIRIPWFMYLYYGDITLAKEHWDRMTRFMFHLSKIAKGHIIYEGYGDMFAPGRIWSSKKQVALTSTAYYYYNANIMSAMATALDKQTEAQRYKELSSKIRDAFIKKFYNFKEKTFGNQTSNVIALKFDLVPVGEENDIAKNLSDDILQKYNGHFETGHLGSRYLFGALANNNYGNVAKTVLIQTTYPSMGELISRGATTFWESWG